VYLNQSRYTVFRATECGFTDFFEYIIKNIGIVKFEFLSAVSSNITISCDMPM